jgi:polysaccharide deacetylase 2 family uncharacterized protein YibQ
MPKRKVSRKKTRSKKSRYRKKISLGQSLVKSLAGLAILLCLVAGIGLLVYYLVPAKQPLKPKPPEKSVAVKKKRVPEKPAFEIYPPVNIPSDRPVIKPKRPLSRKLPKVAIIIDDLGYDSKIAEKFIQLDATLTFAVLPHSPQQKRIVSLAQKRGLEIMLHLPMEPLEYPAVNPGPGTLLTSMSPDQLLDQLAKNLDDIPSAAGVNNHMGSKLTAESDQMNQVFSILKKRGLFFIDSRTTADTICMPSARLFKLPFAQRDVFIDHQQQPEFIRKQIRQLLQMAQRHGEAVGIAHPHLETIRVLQEMLPQILKEVQLVPASEIVHVIG